MAQKPIEMEQLKQVLQLSKEGVKIREIARRVGICRNSVRNYLRLLESKDLSDKELAENAYNNEQQDAQTQRHYDLVQHFMAHVKELGKPGVTRQLLWTEYLLQHADGYGYSQYCHHLGGWLNKQDLAMHLEYTPGDLMMIDFAGKKFHYTEKDTGKMVPCEVFVSVLPYSGMIFCLAVASQQTADFVTCINRMLRFFGGIPKTILCDNLKTAVIRSDKYEPVFTDVERPAIGEATLRIQDAVFLGDALVRITQNGVIQVERLGKLLVFFGSVDAGCEVGDLQFVERLAINNTELQTKFIAHLVPPLNLQCCRTKNHDSRAFRLDKGCMRPKSWRIRSRAIQTTTTSCRIAGPSKSSAGASRMTLRAPIPKRKSSLNNLPSENA